MTTVELWIETLLPVFTTTEVIPLRSENAFPPIVELPVVTVPWTVFPETTASMHPGDTLVLYTDGVTEARGADDLFGRTGRGRA